MRQLVKPMRDIREILDRCSASISDIDFANRLEVATETLAVAAQSYDATATLSGLYAVESADTVAGVVSRQEMEWLYKNKLVRRTSPARVFYDEILTAAPNGICPLCGQRTVSTLDHYLAKTLHPAFAVTPANLVPACRDCNAEKLDHQPSCAEEQTLHPYYDNVEDHIWLYASVVEGTPPALHFYASPPADWPAIKAERVRFHFSSFKLANLYGAHAAAELIQIQYALLRVGERGGVGAVRSHLEDQAESRRQAHRNSWQAAMYSALSTSPWFCEEGYRRIRDGGHI